jgi:hypothetical protein
MSQTVPAEVVTRSYWAYVAAAMVNGLTRILDQNASPEAIPKRVYADVQEFFKLALEAAGDGLPQNPSASISNYIIAAGAARAVPQPPEDRADLLARLEHYSSVVNKLEAGEPLTKTENEAAATLKEFFLQVQHEAEAEAYDRVVESDPYRTIFRAT